MGNGSSIATKCGVITFGRNFGITGNFHIASYSSITIGDNLSSSWDVSIFDTDFHNCSNPIDDEKYPISKPIVIGDCVWLCQQSLILKNSEIPSWTTVAARSVVNKSFREIEPYSIIAGTPAKLISKKIRRDDVLAANERMRTWQITRGTSTFSPVK